MHFRKTWLFHPLGCCRKHCHMQPFLPRVCLSIFLSVKGNSLNSFQGSRSYKNLKFPMEHKRIQNGGERKRAAVYIIYTIHIIKFLFLYYQSVSLGSRSPPCNMESPPCELFFVLFGVVELGNYRTKMVCNSPSRDVLDQQIQAFGRECVEESTDSLF